MIIHFESNHLLVQFQQSTIFHGKIMHFLSSPYRSTQDLLGRSKVFHFHYQRQTMYILVLFLKTQLIVSIVLIFIK